MGAWGTQPKDNDGAWDITDTALAEAEKWLASRWKRFGTSPRPRRPKGMPKRRMSKWIAGTWGNPAWRRADVLFVCAGAVQILLERGVFVRRALVEDAVRYIRVVLATPEYMRGWKDPAASRRSIHRILVAMEGLLKQGFWRGQRRKRRWLVSAAGYEKLSERQRAGLRFVPSSYVLAPVGWPRKDAGKRSWTGIEYRRSHPRRRAT